MTHFAPKPLKDRKKWLQYATGIVIVAYYLSCIFQFAFQCMPRKGQWDPTVHPECDNSAALTFAATAFGLLTDLMLYALLVWLMMTIGTSKLGGWRNLLPINTIGLL